ncbi:AsnC family transcriptional regulator [Pectinatus frisingensis]|jgi:DNA-binding Lrp family transcriptional regulator|uniref:siroheme decarboxylase subunit beta n=1 Tax=Pectinatus frisingensis TaxID=865 RepID=UPI0015F6A2FC|nr:AsnC family transcriptional regulator [Pectinatus frisingensis]
MDALDKKIIKVMQNDFPLVAKPYEELADRIGISEAELLERLKKYKQNGQIRKMGAVLGHYTAGFSANVLCAWVVPKERMDETGRAMAANAAVSHCYDRTTTPEWPYNVYTMIHAKTHNECNAIVDELARENNLDRRVMLYSVKEWKKTSMHYFQDEKIAQ